jgi:guanine deaminase
LIASNGLVRGLCVFRAALLDFGDDPALAGSAAVRYVEDGALLVENGWIARSGAADEVLRSLPAGLPVRDLRGRLITPGFVDAHVHYPYRAPPEDFLDSLLASGTTTAAIFPDSHVESLHRLFAAGESRRLRLVAGRLIADPQGGAGEGEDAADSYVESARLIERWHGSRRVSFAVTLESAGRATERQLGFARRLLDAYPGLHFQAQLAQRGGESEALDRCAQYGLIRPRALFAHGATLDEADWQRIGAFGASAVHCPAPGSPLRFDPELARSARARWALASNRGAASLGMLRMMQLACRGAAGPGFSALEAFYAATLGGARALGLEERIGSFAPGREADFNVINFGATPLLERRAANAGAIEEKLAALLAIGNDRAIEATFVLGVHAVQQGVGTAPRETAQQPVAASQAL